MKTIARGVLGVFALGVFGLGATSHLQFEAAAQAQGAAAVKASKHSLDLCGINDPALRRDHKRLVEKDASGLTAAQIAEVNSLLDLYNGENSTDYSDSHITCNAEFLRRFGPDLVLIWVSVGQAEATSHFTLLFEIKPNQIGPEPLLQAKGRVAQWVDLDGDGQEEWIFADHHSFTVARWDRTARKLVNLSIGQSPELSFESSQDTLENCPYTNFTYRIDPAEKPTPVLEISTLFRDSGAEKTSRSCAPDLLRTDIRYQWDTAKSALAKVSERSGREPVKKK